MLERLFYIFVVSVFCFGFVSASLGVSAPRPLQLNVGEKGELVFNVYNTEDVDLRVNVGISEGGEIAYLIDNNTEYDVGTGDKLIVRVGVNAPGALEQDEQYVVKIFLNSESDEIKSENVGFDVNVQSPPAYVYVIAEPFLEFEGEIGTKFTWIFIWGIIIVIALIVGFLAWRFIKRKVERKSSLIGQHKFS